MFADTSAENFIGDERVVAIMMLIDHVTHMVRLMESTSTERACRELLSH